MKIGVMALQGDYGAHGRMLRRIGVEPVEVRSVSDLDGLDGLILPGGESTTMLKLLSEEGLDRALVDFAERKPLFGTCAGVILMARETLSPAQRCFGLLDAQVERNAYGRQLDSSIRRLQPAPAFTERTGPGDLEAMFIRAPIIRSVGPDVTVLARSGDDPVLVQQGSRLAATFHPELTADERVHRLFVDTIRSD